MLQLPLSIVYNDSAKILLSLLSLIIEKALLMSSKLFESFGFDLKLEDIGKC